MRGSDRAAPPGGSMPEPSNRGGAVFVVAPAIGRAGAIGDPLNGARTSLPPRPAEGAMPVRPTSAALPLVIMGLVVISWGMGPPIAKLLSAPPMVSAVIRFGMSTPFLLAVLALRGRWLSRRVFWQTALPGLSFGINMVFVFAAVQQVTISVMSVMMALQPAMLLAVVGPLFGDRVGFRQIAFTLLGVGGAVGVIAGAGGDFRASAFGLFLTAMSVLTFTVYFVLTRMARSASAVDPMEWMAGINFWSLIAAIPPTLLWVSPAGWREFGGYDWLWIVIVAFVTGVFGHVLMTWCHAHLEVARSSLYVLAMHIVAVGMAWMIHGEPVTLTQFAGGAVVLFSVAMVIRTPASVRHEPAAASR
ncbi:EamA family transporter [Candidatus Poriferisodalis sp.]|uniref:DMT family transporter n=1 Tax=Candidatus Poriferisodalis sp. TaxID=3101277 RepID=UPI003B59DA58